MNPAERTPSKRGLLKERLELEPVKLKDGRSRVTIKPIDDELTFDKGFYVFIRALQILKSANDGVVLVGLAGASGSGKTAFSEKVKTFMPGIAVMSVDMYNDASRLVDGNFDDPRLTDYDLLLRNLADLQKGRSVQVPIYDFKQSRRVGYQHLDVPSARVVIIEGIYALSERLRPLLDLRVSITGGVHFDLVKRVLRDISRSGQGAEEIIQQITDTVYPMYKAFIEPDLRSAQLRIYNAFNPFSGFMNAFYILKSPKVPEVPDVLRVLGAAVSQKREVEMYDIYLLPPNEDPETCQSWLRMRNKDGRYSLMFEEWVSEGSFIISPRISFEVSVRILGGLMALGYEIGTIMKRTSFIFTSDDVTVKLDTIENLGQFVQVQGKDRDRVGTIGHELGLDGTYIPKSYIEQVQLERLTKDFQNVTEDVRKRFTLDGAPLLDAMLGSSPSTAVSGLGGTGPGPLMRSFSSGLSLGSNLPPASILGTSAPVAIKRKGSGTPGLNGAGRAMSGSAPLKNGGLSQQLKGSPNSSCSPASNVSPRHTHTHLEVDRNGSGALMNGAGGGAISLGQLSEHLQMLSEHVSRYSGLSLQMDAVVHQYRALNEHIASLVSATSALACTVERSAASDKAAAHAAAWTWPGTGSAAALLAAGALCAVAGGTVAVLLLQRTAR